jgi:hypothetical protein
MELSVINYAVSLVKDKFRINFSVSTLQYTDDAVIDNCIRYGAVPRLEMTIIVEMPDDNPFWTTELDYVIFMSDLEDESRVDKVIGGDIRSYDPEVRQAMRLAFILYNGIQYGVRNMQKEEYLDKGWHPRVVDVRKNLV